MNKMSFIIRWIEMALVWQQRRRERRALLKLNDWQLKDIGLTRSDVYREASKSFWQA